MAPRPRPVWERFWYKVSVGDDCWEWQAFRNARGYGKFQMARGQAPRNASRVAYELWHGHEVPSGLNVLHHCDNPPCCRPDHLYVGTTSDNVKDSYNRGRRARTVPFDSAVGPSCKHGHPFDEANTFLTAEGWRRCRACRRNTQQRFMVRKNS